MKITGIETSLLRIPYRTSGGLQFIAGRPSEGLQMVLTRISTDTGLEGWGEAFGHAAAAATRTALDTLVAPLLIGQDPADIDGLMLDLRKKLHLFGRSGPVIYALSGVDIALWDLAGKSAGLPLYRLLGAAPRDDVAAYTSLLRCTDVAAVAESCRRAIAQGFRHIKLHERDVASVAAAREAAGPDAEIMLDTNCPWSPDEAVAMAAAMRPHRLLWLEEPIWPPEDYAGLARVRASGATVAVGENVASSEDFRHMFAADAVDIVQPSITKIGGMSEIRKVIALADAHGVRVVPHCGYLGSGYLASLHLVASLPGEAMLERLAIDLAASPFGAWTDTPAGRAKLPQTPGLGCDPDPEVIARYRVPEAG
ncbi:MAG: mandelate racemase/muconate lactonizing enzyme family protein [Acetobacteraceae bacterium]